MKTIGLFLVLAICGVVTGCDSSTIDPKQFEEAVKVCGGSEKTKSIKSFYNDENARKVKSVNCKDGAKYNVHISANAKIVKVYK